MKASTLRTLHRRIGLACALGLLAASSSGILHVVMTWTQSAPPRPAPEGMIDAARVGVHPAEVLRQFAPNSVTGLSLRMIGGEPWWQVTTGGTPRYLSAVNGREDAGQDAVYAREIAARYLNGAPLRWTRRVEAFDREYIPIFRLLPVHRIEADDGKGTRLYVSTVTGSVARHTDDRRQREADLFSILHKYQFIPVKAWRDAALVTVTSLMFLTALGGLWLFFATRKSRTSLPAA